MRIAAYGAGGYTGKLVVAELARRDIKTVLVGRNVERLGEAAALAGLAAVDGAVIRCAESGDHTALVHAFQDCAAVINCAGPFVLSGEAVVRAAIAAGCHYVDIAGEQHHLDRIFSAFAAPAAAGGVTVVPGTNDDGLPSDLLAHLVAERVRPVRDLVIALELVRSGAMPSRGTLRSALENIDAFTGGGLGYEDGRWHPDIAARRTALTFPDGSDPVPVVKFPLPAVVTVPHHVAARRVEGVVPAELAAAFADITPALIDSVPEGPPADSRRTARWIIVVEATGEDGRHARGVVQGIDMQGSTAVIAVESARRLVADGAKPGVLAPAQAYSPADFLEFLVQHGVRWSVDATGRAADARQVL
ncbi:saccharopine dehydrogenase family protein [Streptomyces sp. NPDC001401]|uniref:saccharopine dehydrogenase family protein n=1 Tax=Streptomyces sp. NPDC001401 TaxID=3364570 RepID=UPI0036AB6142